MFALPVSQRKALSSALKVDTGLNIPHMTELQEYEGELCGTMYHKSSINIKNNWLR